MRRWIPVDISGCRTSRICGGAAGLLPDGSATVREDAPDRPGRHFLEPDAQWNGLINAVSTYVNGAELERVSARDFVRYADSGVNWRVVEGYGTTIARMRRACR